MKQKELNNTSPSKQDSAVLPKSRILRGKQNFDRIFSESERLGAPFVVLRYRIYDEPTEGFQVGFITPKKIGKAVHRNRIRRKLREAFRLQQHILLPGLRELNKGLHMVLIARTSEANTQQIHSSVGNLLKELSSHLTGIPSGIDQPES